MYIIWSPLFTFISNHIGFTIEAAWVIAGLLILQALVITTTNINTADMFYVFLTFIQGLLMLVAFPFFVIWITSIVKEFESDMSTHWAPITILALFPLLHTIMSVTKPLAFFSVIYWWAMIPTSALTLPFYSFVHMDDFSWGNR